jgi:serine/threonine protein kinase
MQTGHKDSPVKLPEKLGRYRILDLINRGSTGAVYTAYDPISDKDVAIKTVSLDENLHKKAESIARARFYHEARIARILDHPNILRVLDAGEDGEHPYVVMEYVEGGKTLSAHCKPPNLLPVSSIAETIQKIANALDHVHRCGVIHQNIKPSNIMIMPDGDVKLADFGTSTSSCNEATHDNLTASPQYMSPEQARGEPVTNQTDFYSLGAVMFELLTGRAVFSARSLNALSTKTIHEEPPCLKDLRPDVPEGLGIIVQAALEKNLDRRYKLGREMASELLTVFENIDGLAPLPSEKKFGALRPLQFFSGFSDSELEEIIQAGNWVAYTPGDKILTCSESDTSLFIVVSGEVVFLRDRRKFLTIPIGHCFGDVAESTTIKHRSKILAETPVSLLELNRVRMARLSDACQQRLYEVFLRVLIHRLV